MVFFGEFRRIRYAITGVAADAARRRTPVREDHV
jgi:hypothetical protein